MVMIMPSVNEVIVVDACVLRAAGTTDAPMSSRCRAFLEKLRVSDHSVGVSPPILTEWVKHASRWSHRWRLRMTDLGKIRDVKWVRNNDLRRAIRTYLDESSQESAEKDAHLIETALQLDEVVVSTDSTARGLFRQIASQMPSVARITWLHPVEAHSECCSYLDEPVLQRHHHILGADSEVAASD